MLVKDAMRYFILLSLLPALLLGGCVASSPDLSSPASLSGKANYGGEPVAGVRISAYPADSHSLGEVAPYRTPPTAGDGRFALPLPPGDYYLLADGEGLFTYYGRNPVTVSGEAPLEVNLGMVQTHGALPEGEPLIETGVLGRVAVDGEPQAGAMIFVYTDLGSHLKGMGYAMGGPTDEGGLFEVALPPGTYYLLARLRQGAGRLGPLKAGDLIGYLPGNPVRVAQGEVTRVALPLLEVPQKVDQAKDRLFGRTAIHGVIVDAGGNPVSGVRAVLYDNPQMLNRPLFVSRPSDPDGRFVLSFPHGGTYYLAARNTLGGAPGPGDLFGTYDESPDHALEVREGEVLEGVRVVVEEMW